MRAELSCFMTFLVVAATQTLKPFVVRGPLVTVPLPADEGKYRPLLNGFGIQLYKELSNVNGSAENALVNSMQITSALLMSCNAATGPAQAELRNMIKVDQKDTCLDVADILWKMAEKAPHRVEDLGGFKDLYLVANRVYADKSIKLVQQFMDNLNNRIHRAPGTTDFGNADGARKEINDWVSKTTHGNVKNFLGKDTLNKKNKLHLLVISGDFLKFHWAFPFNPKNTTKGTFTNTDGSQSNVDFMSMDNSIFYKQIDADAATKSPAFHAIKLPSKDGTFTLSILLPVDPKGFQALETALSADLVYKAVGPEMKERKLVNLKLPKIKIDQTMDLLPALKKMGVNILFEGTADLSPMTPTKPMEVDAWTHKAEIDVDEKGLKAASVTSSVDRKGAPQTAKPLEIKVDHPFLFVVQFESTGYIMDIGRVHKL